MSGSGSLSSIFPVPGLLLGLAAVALLVTALPGIPVVEPEEGFAVFHMNSALAEGNSKFQEIFVVDRVAPDLAANIEGVEMFLDGEPFAVLWEPASGPLQRNATFSFVMEAFDQQQVLTAKWQGEEVMRCQFGGGAGFAGLHPDELRSMGQGHKIRCLDGAADG